MKGDVGYLNVKLFTINGVLGERNITFTLDNGKTYSTTTHSNGIATFKVTDYLTSLGSHDVTVSYAGDDVNSKVSVVSKVNIFMYKAILNVTQFGKYYGDKHLSFSLVDYYDSSIVYNKVPIHVTAYSNGNAYKTDDISTNPEGVAVFDMSDFVPDNYTVYAYATTPNVDINSIDGATVEVLKISGVIELEKSSNNKTLYIRAYNPANGDVYNGIPVKLSFNPNGHTAEVTTDASGLASFAMKFDPGTYSVRASVDSYGYKEFATVEMNDIYISIGGNPDSSIEFKNPIVFDYGGIGNATYTVEGGAIGEISVAGHPEARSYVMDNVIFVYSLDAGNYTLSVVTVPDEDHNSVTRNLSVTVNPIDSNIAINPVSGDFGSTITVIPYNIVGCDISYETVSVEGQNPQISVINNVISIIGLPVGTHMLRVTTIPKSNYKSVTHTTNITVNKVDSKISYDGPISFVYGGAGSMPLRLDGCKVIPTGCSIDGHPEANISVDENDVLSVSNLPVGSYTLRMTSSPDSNHNAVTRAIVVSVSPADSGINFSSDSIVFDYGGVGSVQMTLEGCDVLISGVSVDDNPLAVIYVNNNTINVSNLASGSYVMRVTSTPDSNHNAITKTIGITVNKPSSKIGFTSDAIVFNYLGEGTTTLILDGCTVNLNDIFIEDYPDADITINKNNMITVRGLDSGSYTLSVSGTPDSNHKASSASIDVVVNKIDSEIKYSKSIVFNYLGSGSTFVTVDGGSL